MFTLHVCAWLCIIIHCCNVFISTPGSLEASYVAAQNTLNPAEPLKLSCFYIQTNEKSCLHLASPTEVYCVYSLGLTKWLNHPLAGFSSSPELLSGQQINLKVLTCEMCEREGQRS